MADVYYKKPNGEVFKYQAGRMKKSSCDEKYTLCDLNGKAVKIETKKAKWRSIQISGRSYEKGIL